VPLPARPPPSFQEQLLAPIPTQFDWIQREVRPNPMLETLLTGAFGDSYGPQVTSL
jgi:hypothetical protein